ALVPVGCANADWRLGADHPAGPHLRLHDPSAGIRAGQPDGRMTTLYRPDVLRVVDEVFDEQPVVLTIGGVIREMLALVGRKPNHLYSLDAMGQTVAIGLGLALGLEKE